MARDVHVCRAQPTISTEVVESCFISIAADLPDGLTVEAAQNLYAQQGAALAKAIFDTCPGGTVDALLAELFRRRSSLFRIRFSSQPEERPGCPMDCRCKCHDPRSPSDG
jgi:hypothetical protein